MQSANDGNVHNITKVKMNECVVTSSKWEGRHPCPVSSAHHALDNMSKSAKDNSK